MYSATILFFSNGHLVSKFESPTAAAQEMSKIAAAIFDCSKKTFPELVKNKIDEIALHIWHNGIICVSEMMPINETTNFDAACEEIAKITNILFGERQS